MKRFELFVHYKGDLYVVFGEADNSTNNSKDLNDYTLYYSLERDTVHIRKTSEFHETVMWPDGVERSRFAPASTIDDIELFIIISRKLSVPFSKTLFTQIQAASKRSELDAATQALLKTVLVELKRMAGIDDYVSMLESKEEQLRARIKELETWSAASTQHVKSSYERVRELADELIAAREAMADQRVRGMAGELTAARQTAVVDPKLQELADKVIESTKPKSCSLSVATCPVHGFIHGAEAADLREAIEDFIAAGRDVSGIELMRLLDRVDARDSLAFDESGAKES